MFTIIRLTMKEGSDNRRDTSILDIIKYHKEKDTNIVIFETYLKPNSFEGTNL